MSMVGCSTSTVATAPTVSPTVRLSADVRAYLVDPSGEIEDLPSSQAQSVGAAFAFLNRGDLAAVRDELAVLGSGGAKNLLGAQLAFVEGRYEDARVALASAAEVGSSQLLAARLSELDDDLPGALRAYWPLQERYEIARERAAALLPTVQSKVQAQAARRIGDGLLEEAERQLSDLLTWAPNNEATQRLLVRWGAAAAQPSRELNGWRWLANNAELTPPELGRWADLELAHGRVERAVEVARDLNRVDPGNPQFADLLARAEFSWRSRLLPPQARELMALESLSRAEFAVGVYWFFPQVRYARSKQVRIASDILDHPHRDEISQIVNVGLMGVDRAGHRFRPDLPVSFTEGLSVMLELLQDNAAACVEQTGGACGQGQACGLLVGTDCSSRKGVDGATLADWARRVQEHLTRP